jgi:sugar-specific transcriptional regulator TrmB
MHKYTPLLRGIWVPERGALAYLSLIEYGEMNIADLAKAMLCHRMEVYRQLPLLLEMGLIGEIQRGKRTYYIAHNPQVIQDRYEAQQEAQQVHIEQLQEQYRYLGKKPKVLYQEGKKGITFVFSDIINTLGKWEVFYRVSSEKDVSLANSYLPKDYRSKRDKKQLERYVIMSELGASQKTPRLEREVMTIPKEFDDFADNISLTIYGNKIAYIDFTTESSIIIEHQALVDFHKKMFRMLYMSLRG